MGAASGHSASVRIDSLQLAVILFLGISGGYALYLAHYTKLRRADARLNRGSSMANRQILGAILGAVLAPGVILADTVELNTDHPETYVVQRGDTLWDISGRFLSEPWRWPDIWHANPQIDNPHLIYPGDEVYLAYQDGRPVLSVRRGGARPLVKLSPTVREVPLEDLAVPTIPIDAIQQFLLRPRVIGAAELEEAAYVVSLGKERLVGGAGQRLYARGLGDETQNRYTVYRQGEPYLDPDNLEEVLGYEALHIADAVLEKVGDPATMVIASSKREVLAGDRLLPVTEEPLDSHFFPREPDAPVDGRIISVIDGVNQIGQHQVVVLNVGTNDGIDVGHVMAVYQAGEIIDDPYIIRPPRAQTAYIELDPEKQGGLDGFSIAADRLVREISHFTSETITSFIDPTHNDVEQIALPDEKAGHVMVFRPYDDISYALVVDATRPMHIHDAVRNP